MLQTKCHIISNSHYGFNILNCHWLADLNAVVLNQTGGWSKERAVSSLHLSTSKNWQICVQFEFEDIAHSIKTK